MQITETSNSNHPIKLSDYVYHELETRIIDGSLPQGARIFESDIANDLSVSTTPVREAINRLSLEGLLVINPHRNVTVRVLSIDDISNIYDVRSALEVLAVESCCSNMLKDSDIQEMSNALDCAERALQENNLIEYKIHHAKYHDSIINNSNNAMLVHMMNQIRKYIAICVNSTVNFPGRPIAASKEHREILASIIKRDSDQAAELMKKHILVVKKEILEFRTTLR